jgi:hypothetical protein
MLILDRHVSLCAASMAKRVSSLHTSCPSRAQTIFTLGPSLRARAAVGCSGRQRMRPARAGTAVGARMAAFDKAWACTRRLVVFRLGRRPLWVQYQRPGLGVSSRCWCWGAGGSQRWDRTGRGDPAASARAPCKELHATSHEPGAPTPPKALAPSTTAAAERARSRGFCHSHPSRRASHRPRRRGSRQLPHLHKDDQPRSLSLPFRAL